MSVSATLPIPLITLRHLHALKFFREFTCVSLCSGSLQFGGSQGTASWALIAAAMPLWRTTDLPAGREDSLG